MACQNYGHLRYNYFLTFPVKTDGILTMSKEINQTTYNYKVVRQFAITTVLWGIVGMAVGVVIAAQLVWPAGKAVSTNRRQGACLDEIGRAKSTLSSAA